MNNKKLSNKSEFNKPPFPFLRYSRSFSTAISVVVTVALSIIIITSLLAQPPHGLMLPLHDGDSSNINNLLPAAFAATDDLLLRSNEDVFVAGDVLVIYGKADANDALTVRIYDPVGTAIRIDTITADRDGFFREPVFEWPEPSKNLAYGIYTVEVVSTRGLKQQVEVTFAEATQAGPETPKIPVTHTLGVKLDAPEQISTGVPFRIFVQVTFDNALVNSDHPDLLGASHVHSDNSTINLTEFTKLHEGLYYTDVQIDKEGSYVIHSVAFFRGYLSHDSQIVSASATSINTLQNSLDTLGQRLNDTRSEIDRLESRLGETRSALEEGTVSITNSVEEARSSIKEEIEAATAAVKDLSNASGQVNAIILPVLILISVIIALQISLFARIRASFR